MLIINDIHICLNRTGGTTPGSQAALRDYTRAGLQLSLDVEDHEVTVLGDLFDGFTVDIAEVIKTYDLFAEWLDGGIRTLNLIQGNHDATERCGKVSSFHTLCHFLTARFGNKVRVFDSGFGQLNDKVFCISHVPNQSIFDMELEKAINMDGDGRYLLLHANIKNTFAEHSDHSLNVNDTQLGNLMRAGYVVICAHEHQGYELRGGRVIVIGNQRPTSISDCLGETTKRALKITEDMGREVVQTWTANGNYAEVDWRSEDVPVAKFIRFTGDATANEAAEVISKIAKFRQRCGDDVFVVGNAVRVEGHDMCGEDAAANIEDIRAFDVMQAILDELTPEEQRVVKGLTDAA